MKRFIFIGILSFIIMSACNEEEFFFTPEVKMSLENSENTETLLNKTIKYSLMARDYLVLSENKYDLTLTKEDALNLGIPENEYLRMLKEIKIANEKIQEWIDSNKVFTLTDPQMNSQMDCDIQYVRLKTRGREISDTDTIIKGNIVTEDQKVGIDGFFALIGVTTVTFTCRANAALTPIYNVTTEAFGQTNAGGGIGVIGRNSVFVVPLAASNVPASVTFQVSDDNGGSCAWETNSVMKPWEPWW